MYAIIDKRSPQEVKDKLARYVGDVFEFSSDNITYNSISGHPDIFMFQDSKKLIVAPNAPEELLGFLDKNKVNYSLGIEPVGDTLDESVLYNCLCTSEYFFCKKEKPDITIQDYSAKKQLINLPQAYVRCSLFCIGDNKMITSDLGIAKVLENNEIEYFYFAPTQINIVDHKNGFIGGTMGGMDDNVFFLGDVFKHKDGKALYDYITASEKNVVCLGKDYLYDGGGIFFVS